MAERRNKVYKKSSLPYSFNYKIVKAFDGDRCPICNYVMGRHFDSEFGIVSTNRIPTIQHNKPIANGGLHEIDNISIICKQCNITIKNNETPKLNNNKVKEVWYKWQKNTIG
jgi:5-methylcytosine-specific restriction endonuclease McrA